MILHRDGGTSRRGNAGGMPLSAPDLGRLLRRARTRQGLRMEDVSARTGLPLDQLDALEAGTVDRILDRMAILKTLRRYADFLGLPGERFVIALVDHWPAQSTPSPPIAAFQPPAAGLDPGRPVIGTGAHSPLDTGTTPVALAVPGPGAGAQDRTVTDLHDTATANPLAASVHSNTAQVSLTMADTGVTPALPPPGRTETARRPTHAPLALRILVALVALAVLAGVAGLVIHHYEPHWLNSPGGTHAQQPPTRRAAKGSSKGNKGGTRVFTRVSASSDTASFEVRAPVFLVQMTVVGGDCWVQATGAGKTAPTFSGLLDSGQSKFFLVQHSLILEVGSVAAHVVVTVGKQTVGSYIPRVAPFTMTFKGV